MRRHHVGLDGPSAGGGCRSTPAGNWAIPSRFRREAAAILAVLLLSPVCEAAFSTTLHGSPTETIQPGTPGAATMELQPWLTEYDADAVCNDGSPAGYYYLQGDPNLWLFYLEGGYWCWDGSSCNLRYQTLAFDMSSKGWKQYFAQNGIFSTVPDQNPFANASMVFVKYCSSDSWFGDAPAGNPTFGFAFRGSRIVQAAIHAMVNYNGMGSAPGETRMLFAGCSAGGRGVLTNLDAVAHTLRKIAPSVRVQGFLDAAAWVDVEPVIPDMMTLQDMTKLLFQFTNPPVPKECYDTYVNVTSESTSSDVSGLQGPISEAWKCVWPSYRLPYVKTDYFLNAAQFDAFQIMYDTDNLNASFCCTTPQTEAYVEQFQTSTLSLFRALQSSRWAPTLYSSSCLVHCLSSNADWYQFTTNGVSLMEAVKRWFFRPTTGVYSVLRPANIIDSCTGWNCTLKCSGGPWQPSNQPCLTTTNVCANTYMYGPSATTEAVAPAPAPGPAPVLSPPPLTMTTLFPRRPAPSRKAGASASALAPAGAPTPAPAARRQRGGGAGSGTAGRASSSALSFFEVTSHLVVLAALVLSAAAFMFVRRSRRQAWGGGAGETKPLLKRPQSQSGTELGTQPDLVQFHERTHGGQLPKVDPYAAAAEGGGKGYQAGGPGGRGAGTTGTTGAGTGATGATGAGAGAGPGPGAAGGGQPHSRQILKVMRLARDKAQAEAAQQAQAASPPSPRAGVGAPSIYAAADAAPPSAAAEALLAVRAAAAASAAAPTTILRSVSPSSLKRGVQAKQEVVAGSLDPARQREEEKKAMAELMKRAQQVYQGSPKEGGN